MIEPLTISIFFCQTNSLTRAVGTRVPTTCVFQRFCNHVFVRRARSFLFLDLNFSHLFAQTNLDTCRSPLAAAHGQRGSF